MTLRHNYHGGGCCGARHIYSFNRTTTQESLASLLGQLRDGQLAEVILTRIQCRKLPEVLDWDAWRNGNSGNVCYRFSRADKRHSLTECPNWNGRIIKPSTEGLLKNTLNKPNTRATYQRKGLRRGRDY